MNQAPMFVISADVCDIRLYESSAYSDLTVIYKEDVYKVHKAIICPRSDFFSNKCRGGRWKVLQPHAEPEN